MSNTPVSSTTAVAVPWVGGCLLSLALFFVGCSGDDGDGGPTGNGGAVSASGGASFGGMMQSTGGGGPGAGGLAGGAAGRPGTGGANPAAGGAPAMGGGGGVDSGTGGMGPAAGGAAAGAGGVDPVGNANRAPGFVDLTPPMGDPLPDEGTVLNPPAPAGWQWHLIEGAVCRDASPAGIFVHKGTVDKLLFFLEGGGACSNTSFCRFNPKNVNEILSGDGATVLATAGGAIAGRQQPGAYTGGVPSGIFDETNAANPFKDWSKVYVPYCTGDVHFGTQRDVTVPPAANTDARDISKHQFVGYLNMQKIVGRVVPTFGSVSQVVLTGSSAGSFGAELNSTMVQDAFGDVPVTVLADSGSPFSDEFMPVCMQKRWRDAWGLAFPPDCTECEQADGGGMLGMADFLIRKHPNMNIGAISTMEDEVIRLFFSVGLQSCANYDTADPVAITLAQVDPNVYMPAAQYTGGLNALRTQYESTGRLATFFLPGTLHQHVFRATFYTSTAGGKTMAAYVTDFLSGTTAQLGP